MVVPTLASSVYRVEHQALKPRFASRNSITSALVMAGLFTAPVVLVMLVEAKSILFFYPNKRVTAVRGRNLLGRLLRPTTTEVRTLFVNTTPTFIG